MILQKRYKIEIQIPTDSLRKKLFCKDIIVGALDKRKYSLISSSWAASFYGKGQQTACIQCLGAYATTQSSYKNYNTAIKSELSQAIPTANSSWAANAPLNTVLYSASKLLFFKFSLTGLMKQAVQCAQKVISSKPEHLQNLTGLWLHYQNDFVLFIGLYPWELGARLTCILGMSGFC